MANGNGAAQATPFPSHPIAASEVSLSPLLERRAEFIDQPIDSIDDQCPALFELGNARLSLFEPGLQAVALGLHCCKPLRRICRRNR